MDKLTLTTTCLASTLNSRTMLSRRAFKSPNTLRITVSSRELWFRMSLQGARLLEHAVPCLPAPASAESHVRAGRPHTGTLAAAHSRCAQRPILTVRSRRQTSCAQELLPRPRRQRPWPGASERATYAIVDAIVWACTGCGRIPRWASGCQYARQGLHACRRYTWRQQQAHPALVPDVRSALGACAGMQRWPLLRTAERICGCSLPGASWCRSALRC